MCGYVRACVCSVLSDNEGDEIEMKMESEIEEIEDPIDTAWRDEDSPGYRCSGLTLHSASDQRRVRQPSSSVTGSFILSESKEGCWEWESVNPAEREPGGACEVGSGFRREDE